ncbi:MAG: helix-hairpin-helix domain-containing protein [Candidatus Odinarchaeota archaeon]
MTAKSLTDFRGIGEGLAKKLVENFGSEAAALEALESSDVEAISRIEGVGERLATRLIRIYHDVNPELFLVTQDSLAIYRRLIKKIQAHASTPHARARGILLSPITEIGEIRKIQKFSESCFTKASSLAGQEKEIASLLRSLAPLRQGTNLVDTGDRIIYTDDLDLQEKLESHEIGQYCGIEYTESFETLLETRAQGSSEHLIFISKEDFHGDEEGITILGAENAFNITKTIPEREIAFFAINKRTLTVLLKLLAIFSARIPADFGDLTSKYDVQELASLLDQIKDTGEIEENIDPELDRINSAIENFDNALMDLEVELNESLTEFFSKSTIELEGQKLLELLKSGDNSEQVDVREFLDPSLYLHVEEELEKREETLSKKFNLKDEEESLVHELFPRQMEFPVTHSDERLEQLKNVLSSKVKSRAYNNKVRIAEKLKIWKEFSYLLNRRVLELDYQLMIGKFMLKNNLRLPEMTESGIGIVFEDGVNLELINDQEHDSVLQKVRYQAGTIGNLKERVVLLSGANSGGKTTLLMLLAQAVILSHMGIGVPAVNCRVSLFKEFHYYKKSSGSYSAGAFETFLNSFTQILKGEGSKLVLADEMESISEPGASALVISAFLDALNESPEACGVFVSHLAAQIKNHCKTNVRIDGIEASGLDDELRLIVNRNPIYGLYARSTPQLIVERLSKLAKGKEKEIFTDIVSRFKALQE